MEALIAEAGARAALYVATVEAEDVRAMITKEKTQMLTIESSPKWGGNLIKEEQKNAETEDIPSTSAANLEIPAP